MSVAAGADILHIEASPKGKRSASGHVARAFLEAYIASHPADRVRTLNVFDAELPEFDAVAASAKFAPIELRMPTDEEQAAWQAVMAIIDQVERADKIVLSCPMWNFHVPYPLKHLIDLLVQPGLTFGFDHTGHVGLLADRPLQLILSRSGYYREGDSEDFQLPYLRHIWSFIGIHDIRVMTIEGTTLPQEERDELIERHAAEAQVIAEAF